MQTMSPLALYQQALENGEYQADEVQREAMTRLDGIYQALTRADTPAAPASGGLLGKLNKLLGKSKTDAQPPPVACICGAESGAVRPG